MQSHWIRPPGNDQDRLMHECVQSPPNKNNKERPG